MTSHHLGLLALALVACAGDKESPTDTGTTPTPTDTAAPQPCIEVEPASLDFGEVVLGDDPGPQTLDIRNGCDGDLVVDGVALVGGSDFTIEDAPAPGTTLGMGQSAAITIDSAPSSYGTLSDTLRIESNDPASPTEVSLELVSVCTSAADDVDSDGDTVPDDCDVCEGGDDALDADADTVPDACDACDGEDDRLDADFDTVPDACDLCEGFDDREDKDGDGTPDGCDPCSLGGDDTLDSDSDTVPDACDLCEGFDDLVDTDGDGIPGDGSPASCDVCEGADDFLDDDADTVPNGCDQCPTEDDSIDVDADSVPDCIDIWLAGDDNIDTDADTVPDACDACPGADDRVDTDLDTVPDVCDVCPAEDDRPDVDMDGVPDCADICLLGPNTPDTDADTVPDACDQCPGADDLLDSDGDTVPDCVDACPGADDLADADGDGAPDACDVCPGEDDTLDADGDTVPDGCDACPGDDDRLDDDLDGVPDACDGCPGFDDTIDTDGDTVPDGCDTCAGEDDRLDADLDDVPDGCDLCPGFDDALDADADTIPDDCEACPGFDDTLDDDMDGTPDGCDLCPGFDDTLDDDVDTVPDDCDACPGFDDLADADSDTVADACDRCDGADDLLDGDADGVPDACDLCVGFDDLLDLDRDGIPDDCDGCAGVPNTITTPAPASSTPQVDVLLVVDDSLSMATYSPSIPAGLQAFVNEMNASGNDWQAAVITSSSSTFLGPVVPGGPNALLQLATQFGFSLSATATANSIDRAYTATQPGGDAAPGSATGFLRTDAALAVVFVTDSADTSAVTPTQARNYWNSLKAGDPSRVRIGAIQAPATDPIDTLVGTGPLFDITTVNFGTASEDIAEALVDPLLTQSLLPLSVVPVPATIDVADGATRLVDWYYDPIEHAIVFPDGSSAGPLTVSYVDDCGGTLGACGDGIDNDGDGATDFPDEIGCASLDDSNEIDPLLPPECLDGLDSDGDTLVDWPNDPECEAASDEDEDCAELFTDVGGYTVCEVAASAPLACPDLSASSSRIPLGGSGTLQVPLGFDLDFYGTTYTDVRIGADGTLTFSGVSPGALNGCLPVATLGDVAFVWWDDLNPFTGDVWARTEGVAPFRRFAVQWKVPHANGGADFDIRAVIDEASGDLEFCYVDTLGAAGTSNGASATAGIQHGTTSFIEASCNTTTLTTGRGLRFEHP